MSMLIQFGYQLWDTYSWLVDFLATEFSFPYITGWQGPLPQIVFITVTPAFLLVGSGLVIVLTVKLYKFILDLIPFA